MCQNHIFFDRKFTAGMVYNIESPKCEKTGGIQWNIPRLIDVKMTSKVFRFRRCKKVKNRYIKKIASMHKQQKILPLFFVVTFYLYR